MKKKVLIIFILVLIDQLIKVLICNTIGKTGNIIFIIPKVLSLTYLQNDTSSFGIFNDRILLIALDLMILFFVIKLLVDKKHNFVNGAKIGFSLIIAGGIGNLIDRLFRGYVIDYLDISELFNYPVFNFADICIVAGVVLIMVVIIIETIRKQEKAIK